MSKAIVWKDIAPKGFSAVVTNPPWEKLRLSKHEYLVRNGASRHYGSNQDATFSSSQLAIERKQLRTYIESLQSKYQFHEGGDKDLYVYFLELSLSLLRNGGQLIAIVPGGLIRSQSTIAIRRCLLAGSPNVAISIFDNRARYFPIDTRFKFLVIDVRNWKLTTKSTCPIKLQFPATRGDDILVRSSVDIGRRRLISLRSDLTIPEVRSRQEWRLFSKLAANHHSFGDARAIWAPHIRREIDMTADKALFEKSANASNIPLIEGRMVHQFRANAKSYVSGSGRAAQWRPNLLSDLLPRPQFWVNPNSLTSQVRAVTSVSRAGFCDITGQTNERTMLAATIPANVICGNKVPTITFDDDVDNHAVNCWIAVANSFAFDWILRRLVSTSVNFFILRSVPVPTYTRGSLPWRFICRLVQRLTAVSSFDSDAWTIAELRAELDSRVAHLYGISWIDLKTIFFDFPLIDRNQPALPGEPKSTITRDLVLLTHQEIYGGLPFNDIRILRRRVQDARLLGAVPFLPSGLSAPTRHSCADVRHPAHLRSVDDAL